MQETKTDLKRSIVNLSSVIYIGVMILVIALGAGMKQLFPENAISLGLMTYYHAQMLTNSLRSDIVLMALPIICTLPYTSAFLDEYSSGYIKSYLMKCDKRQYIKGKILAPAISGGLVLAAGILAFFFIAKLIYSPMENVSEYAIPPFMNVLMYAIKFFFAGALWASVGALLANISLSKYMAYASPFVFFYVLVILQERYFRSLYVINPKEWLIIDHTWPLGSWGAIILMVILTVIICTVNFNIIERRIEG
ncbi:MAG: hypothetical protein JXN65_08425 [Clostridia bacterium]|nr:hypothetical protein [Clostridia bacterium]